MNPLNQRITSLIEEVTEGITELRLKLFNSFPKPRVGDYLRFDPPHHSVSSYTRFTIIGRPKLKQAARIHHFTPSGLLSHYSRLDPGFPSADIILTGEVRARRIWYQSTTLVNTDGPLRPPPLLTLKDSPAIQLSFSPAHLLPNPQSIRCVFFTAHG